MQPSIGLLFLLFCSYTWATLEWTHTIDEALEHINIATVQLEDQLKMYGEQVQRDYLYEQQQIKSEGSSGLKQIRARRTGLKNYHSETHNGYSVAAIHDHANNIRTVGMGELLAVLNGVEFQTRHNDYRLYKPGNSSDLHATEKIEFPDVPPEVQGTVGEQIVEMREWFKAFHEQNYTVRDYRKYFKPVLCYLEGAWMNSDDLVHDFDSDRHSLDARTWHELQEKMRFVGYSGTKSRNENIAWMPTSITGFNGSDPIFSQFNYRILCKPLDRDIPLNRFRVVDDMSSRMMTKRTSYKHLLSRAARFVLNQKDSDDWYDEATGFESDGDHDKYMDPRGLLDDLMAEIPGKDNFPGSLTDQGLEYRYTNVIEPANTAYYHRWIKSEYDDESRTKFQLRGFGDSFMFAAQTSQNKVDTMEVCKKRNWRGECTDLYQQKWTYAIPLEIIYLTPLSKWNPFNIRYAGEAGTPTGDVVTAGGRTGSCLEDKSKAFNGANSKNYYLTPSQFFTGGPIGNDTADTARTGDTCVLDPANNMQRTRASGTRVLFPEINGIGIIRQRYPIMPIHGEGSPVWKELNALKDYYIGLEVSNMKALQWIETNGFHREVVLEMRASNANTGHHTHQITLVTSDIIAMKTGLTQTKISSLSHGHTHDIEIEWQPLEKWFYIKDCDGYWKCQYDEHSRVLRILSVDGISFGELVN